jgi:hypothetical protein
MSAICPSCRWPVRVTDGTFASHPRFDTGERCDGSGTTPEPRATTTAGRALITRLRVEEQEASERADGDEMHSHARVAAKAERDLLRRLLRWVPDEVVRAEHEAVETDRSEDERMTGVLEGVA